MKKLLLMSVCLVLTGEYITAQEHPPGAASANPSEVIEVPVIDGDWWNISPAHPPVGEWSNEKGDACDFTIFQAGDGTWQLIGCRRGCAWPTGERVFYRAEGKNLTDTAWEQKGLFRTPDISIEQVFTIQAPHCIKDGGKWYLYYNAATGFGKTKQRMGNAAYVMVSEDGKKFADMKAPDGNWFWFPMGRDIQIFKDENAGKWFAFFQDACPTAEERMRYPHGRFYYRTAEQAEGPWSMEKKPLDITGNPESPFMIQRNGRYYFWQQMYVYESETAASFTRPPVVKLTGGGRVHGKYAPEIIQDGGQNYMAAYDRNGIWVCKLKWEKKTRAELNEWWRHFEKQYPEK